ncbi:hypothetical protein FKP32DRAFT_1572308 [Trametes sanguinea]|nr:hypothetical protein FKP32DRAFT_1572308 [Trametes sanguinea]
MSLLALDFDILTLVLRQCTLPTLMRLRGASRLADGLVEDEIERRYRSLLKPFVVDSRAFRDELQATSSVLAGSASIRLTFGVDIALPTLQVYACRANFFHVLGYLTTTERYRIIILDRRSSTPYQSYVHAVAKLVRGDQIVELVQSSSDAACLPVLTFWSTALMTCIGGYRFCVPYPTVAEDFGALLSPNAINQNDDVSWLRPLLDNLHSLGLNVKVHHTDPDAPGLPPAPCRATHSPSCPSTVRWLGDRFCLEATTKRTTTTKPPVSFSNAFGIAVVWWRGGAFCTSHAVQGVHYIRPRVQAIPLRFM